MLQDLFWHICIYIYTYIYRICICLFCISKWCENPIIQMLPSLGDQPFHTAQRWPTEMWDDSAIGLGSGDHGYSEKVPWNLSLLILITIMYWYYLYITILDLSNIISNPFILVSSGILLSVCLKALRQQLARLAHEFFRARSRLFWDIQPSRSKSDPTTRP